MVTNIKTQKKNVKAATAARKPVAKKKPATKKPMAKKRSDGFSYAGTKATKQAPRHATRSRRSGKTTVSMNKEGYNGFANYETWAIASLIWEDELADYIYRNVDWTDDDSKIEDDIWGLIWDYCECDDSNMLIYDFMMRGFKAVDWARIREIIYEIVHYEDEDED